MNWGELKTFLEGNKKNRQVVNIVAILLGTGIRNGRGKTYRYALDAVEVQVAANPAAPVQIALSQDMVEDLREETSGVVARVWNYRVGG